jgi:hypothetical protein
MPILGGDKF